MNTREGWGMVKKFIKCNMTFCPNKAVWFRTDEGNTQFGYCEVHKDLGACGRFKLQQFIGGKPV